MNYIVYIKIYNSFEVEAKSEEEAEQKVRELGVFATLKDCDYNVVDTEVIYDLDKLEES